MNEPLFAACLVASPLASFVGSWMGSRRRVRSNAPVTPPRVGADVIDVVEFEAERRSRQRGRPGFGRFAAGYIVDTLEDDREERW